MQSINVLVEASLALKIFTVDQKISPGSGGKLCTEIFPADIGEVLPIHQPFFNLFFTIFCTYVLLQQCMGFIFIKSCLRTSSKNPHY